MHMWQPLAKKFRRRGNACVTVSQCYVNLQDFFIYSFIRRGYNSYILSFSRINKTLYLVETVRCRSGLLERSTGDRGVLGSSPGRAASELWQFRLTHLQLCISRETIKAVGPFYLVSMPGEVKDPTQVCPVVDSTTLK